MNYEAARLRARNLPAAAIGERVTVSIVARAGTHHILSRFSGGPEGEHEQSWSEKVPARIADVVLEAQVGDIIYQRSISPARAQALERYGVVTAEGHLDWGSDANPTLDFGPMGDVTRRSPRRALSPFRSRLIAPDGLEAVGGAVRDAGGTSGGGSG